MLTKRRIQQEAMRYYKHNRLCAQHGVVDCFVSGEYRCALSACFTRRTINKLRTTPDNRLLSECVEYSQELKPWITAIAQAHEDWAAKVTDEKPLLALLTE